MYAPLRHSWRPPYFIGYHTFNPRRDVCALATPFPCVFSSPSFRLSIPGGMYAPLRRVNFGYLRAQKLSFNPRRDVCALATLMLADFLLFFSAFNPKRNICALATPPTRSLSCKRSCFQSQAEYM